MLEAVWENAVKLAMNHVPERIGEVVGIVTKRLVEINRHAQAAELYEGIDAHREAIHVYIAGGLWEQVRARARARVMATAPLDLAYISPHLAHISPTSRPYLARRGSCAAPPRRSTRAR